MRIEDQLRSNDTTKAIVDCMIMQSKQIRNMMRIFRDQVEEDSTLSKESAVKHEYRMQQENELRINPHSLFFFIG